MSVLSALRTATQYAPHSATHPCGCLEVRLVIHVHLWQAHKIAHSLGVSRIMTQCQDTSDPSSSVAHTRAPALTNIFTTLSAPDSQASVQRPKVRICPTLCRCICPCINQHLHNVCCAVLPQPTRAAARNAVVSWFRDSHPPLASPQDSAQSRCVHSIRSKGIRHVGPSLSVTRTPAPASTNIFTTSSAPESQAHRAEVNSPSSSFVSMSAPASMRTRHTAGSDHIAGQKYVSDRH